MIARVCLHCESALACNDLGLCQRCYAVPGFRTLYRPKPHDTPELYDRLLLYRRRAERGEPLFQGEGPPRVRKYPHSRPATHKR